VRRLVFAALVGGLSALANEAADAQTCYTLQAELSHLQSQPSSGGGRARYERAWQEQLDVMARTQAQAEDANCFGDGGFLFFRSEPEPICRVLLPKLRRMQNNLGRLDRLRMLAGRDNSGRIRQLQRMIAARRCGEQQDEEEAVPPPPVPERVYNDAGAPAGGETYHTMCVRSCDGYYFPISFSTTRDKFEADAQTCASMCPDAEAQLFYYPNPEGALDDMVSLQGESYSTSATAYRYRTSIDPSCTCHAANLSPIPEAPQERPALDRSAARTKPSDAPPPKPRPEPGEDPETLADRDGHFIPHSVDSPSTATASSVTTSAGKSVRVVGPAYWGAPAQAGVVLTPVPN
jgi:hypothetical protein